MLNGNVTHFTIFVFINKIISITIKLFTLFILNIENYNYNAIDIIYLLEYNLMQKN